MKNRYDSPLQLPAKRPLAHRSPKRTIASSPTDLPGAAVRAPPKSP